MKQYIQLYLSSLCLKIVVGVLQTTKVTKYSPPGEVHKYQDPRHLLGTTSKLILYQTSEHWNPTLSLCMKCAFVSAQDGSFYRSIEYYTTNRNGAPGMQHKKIILKLTPNITDGLQPHIYVEEERSDSEGSKQSAVHRWLDFKGANQQPVLFGNLQCLITGSYTGGGGPPGGEAPFRRMEGEELRAKFWLQPRDVHDANRWRI
ncbi:uncharacterized protein LOC142587387 isoform X1 [Dermacentor variabilis]|uniref:uncharacterized protein LOC142587387 isoform X1 n=1 Tax=Dermacentor variabilis TaxID=34621 RepID=UPI003F5CAE04